MAFETIEKKHLVDLTAKIKTYHPNWATMVAEKISKEKEWKAYSKNDCTEDNVRHVSNGTIKSQLHRRLFMKIGAQMLLDAVQSTKEVTDLVNQTK